MTEIVELHQVRVVHVGQRSELPLQPQHGLGVYPQQLLQRELLTSLAIPHQVNGASASLPQGALELIASFIVAGGSRLQASHRERMRPKHITT